MQPPAGRHEAWRRASDESYTFTFEHLQRLRRKQAETLNDRFPVGSNFFYVVPHSTKCRCNQLLEIKPDDQAGEVAGVACVWHGADDGARELVHDGRVELGFVMGPPDYYCIIPKRPAGSGWEACTMGDYDCNDCKVGIDKLENDQPRSSSDCGIW